MHEKLEVSTSLLNDLLQYLGTKPYGEVAQLIARIQQEAATQPPKPKATAE